MPLHSSTVLAPRRPRFARAAAIAAACVAAGSATVVIADDQPVTEVRSTAEPSQPAISRYHDIEANKASSMRALGVATMQNSFASPYRDLEANKARTAQAR